LTIAPTQPPTTESRAAEALRRHAAHHGKIQTSPKVPIGPGDFGIWYTPGVAAPCMEIRAHPDLVYEYTNKGNSVAIVTDGSRVLGLGDIGPEAGLPVMEGKALLFKYLGGVDATPLCLSVESPEELIRTVEVVAPSFGGVNLEDIRQPACFQVLDTLRRRLPVPVWHDDQQGTAMVAVAALVNALRLVDKDLASIRIAMIGMGAANVATFRLLRAMGVARNQVVACDSRGILHPERADIEMEHRRFPDKWRICTTTNPEGRTGGIAEALIGADVCIAFSRSGPDVIRPEWIERMASRAIVFACANPVPEIWPREARAAGARIVATGSSDLPNQVNNSLAFPGVFRGVLDVRARSIPDELAIAGARGLADYARHVGIADDHLLPPMDDIEAAVQVAVAVGTTAAGLGLAGVEVAPDALGCRARQTIVASREALGTMVSAGIVTSD
jgi:malate dehydrogenase (oxaloacetate-decarboxylating)